MKKIISKSFYFEAAHKLSNSGKEENKNIHGHSYIVEIFINDQANEINKSGLILDFSIYQNKLDSIKKDLDHRFLNDIYELENPTLENIGLYIYKRLKKMDLHLYKILIKRKSCGETFILKV